jgi:hypothetical protein
MMRHHHIGGALLISAGLVLTAGGAFAQSFPESFAPRCQAAELQPSMAATEACAPRPAQFGLKGPTVLSARDLDVATTGSVSTRRESAGRDESSDTAR